MFELLAETTNSLFYFFFSSNSMPCIIVSVRLRPNRAEHLVMRSASPCDIRKCKLTFLGSSLLIGLPIFFLPFSLILTTPFLDRKEQAVI